MNILLIDYGIEQSEYKTELVTGLQAQGYEVEDRKNLVSGITSIYTDHYVAVVIIVEKNISDCGILVDFLKYVKKETCLKVFVISNEANIIDLEGDIYLPYGTAGFFIAKNLQAGIQKEKNQSLVKFNEKFEYKFTRTELIILKTLMKTPNITVSREEILKTIDPEGNKKNIRIVDIHVKNIREKLNSSNIVSVRGVGYRWIE